MRPKSKEERNVELRRDAARIVVGVESYSAADRTKRAAEVKAAFPPTKVAPKAAAKTVAAKATTNKVTVKKKAAPKGPAPAGMSTGPHDGDLC